MKNEKTENTPQKSEVGFERVVMQREIKFKAWDNMNKTMSNANTLFGWMLYSAWRRLLCNKTWLQFAGLKDKEGKEIYEGDIIKNKDKTYIIKFTSGGFILIEPKEIKSPIPIYEDLSNLQNQSWIQNQKIIGNIYENPELLEVA